MSVYKISEKLPRHEIFGITAQLRRAALSVPTNIVEGYARKSNKELTRFIDIALGSLDETEYLIQLGIDLKYIEPNKEMLALICEIEKLLWGLKKENL